MVVVDAAASSSLARVSVFFWQIFNETTPGHSNVSRQLPRPVPSFPSKRRISAQFITTWRRKSPELSGSVGVSVESARETPGEDVFVPFQVGEDLSWFPGLPF